jgi:hypothetical protein
MIQKLSSIIHHNKTKFYISGKFFVVNLSILFCVLFSSLSSGCSGNNFQISGAQPRSLPAAEVVNIVHSWPSDAHFEFSGLAFYNNYLYVTTNAGLIELRGGKPHTLYTWYDRFNVISGPWKDINRNSLWLLREDDGYLVRLDDSGWHLMKLPMPPKGYHSRGDILEGVTCFSDSKYFRLVTAGHIWRLTESGEWQIEPQPPAVKYSGTVGFASLGRGNLYIVRIDLCPLPPCEYGAYWYESESWGPPLPLQIYRFRGVIVTSEGVFVRGEKGDLLRVEQNKVTPVEIPAPCEAISSTSQGKLIASFRGAGIFVLEKTWIKLFDYPYPDSEGEHRAYLAENNGIVAFATAAVPQLKRKNNKEEWYYTGTDALWVSEGDRLVRVNIP